MASLRDYTVQEVLNKRHVRYADSGQTVFTSHASGNYLALTKPWSSIRCFNTGGDGSTTNPGNTFSTGPFGSADASGNLGGGEKLFTTHYARTTGTVAFDAVTIPYDGANDTFPESGTLYTIAYKDIDASATADDTIPTVQKLTYTGRTGTTTGNFTGVAGWNAHATIGDAAQTEGLEDDMVLSLYKDQNDTLVKGHPRAIEIFNTTAYPIYLKFNDPQSDTMVYVAASATTMFDEMTEIEDLFFGYVGSGTATVFWTLWY